MPDNLIYGWAALCAIVGRSRQQLWRDIRAGAFPPPLRVGPNAVGWREAEISDWIASRPRQTYRPVRRRFFEDAR
jgi:prophage regulatory protein